jgi:hypothetical protein
MARLKRGSRTLAKAEDRASRLRHVDARLNLGQGASLTALRREIDRTKARLKSYNQLLAQADGALIDLVQSERRLADLSERLLQGVAARYGRNSGQYEIAGGTRKNRVRRTRRSQPARPEVAAAATAPVKEPRERSAAPPSAPAAPMPAHHSADAEQRDQASRTRPKLKGAARARAVLVPPLGCPRAR